MPTCRHLSSNHFEAARDSEYVFSRKVWRDGGVSTNNYSKLTVNMGLCGIHRHQPHLVNGPIP